MKLSLAGAALCAFVPLLSAQDAPAKAAPPAGPKFETARITRLEPVSRLQFIRLSGVHGGRYELGNASMVDLIRTAYGYQNDKIIGGPNWLEQTRYNLTAKVPGETSPDDLKLMLQALLGERFALKVTKKDQPLPTYALTEGKGNKMKEGDNSGESGCRPQASAPGPPGPGVGGMVMLSINRPSPNPAHRIQRNGGLHLPQRHDGRLRGSDARPVVRDQPRV
jgi:uncharacterized protein (TIGR03435 family)